MSEGRTNSEALDVAFRQSQFADHLLNHQRWSVYKPVGTTDNEWRLTLHADGDGLDHARLMLNLTELYFTRDKKNSSQLSDEEKELVFIAMAVQDWGKSYADELSPGEDINYEAITIDEVEHRKRKLHTVLDVVAPHIDVKRRFIVERTIYDRTSKLGEVFDAIRRLNCIRTALIAYERYKSHPSEEANANLGALSLSTLTNQLPYLITYAEKYDPVSQALEEAKKRIELILGDKSIRDHKFVSNQQTIEAIERTEIIWNRSHGERSVTSKDSMRPKDDTLFGPRSLFERRFINSNDELLKVVESLKALGMKITLTSGSFDLLHVGHAAYLERASEHGDILVVGVDSDSKIKHRKGQSRPIVGESERLRLLSHLRGVDILTLKDASEEKWGLIKLVRPDTLVVTAETYSSAEIKKLEELYCERVVVLEPQATTSTGAQIRKIQIGEHEVVTTAIKELVDQSDIPDETKRLLAGLLLRLRSGS